MASSRAIVPPTPSRGLNVLDLFSCVGCHALGMERAGHRTVALCESKSWRRERLAQNFPGVLIHHDVRDFEPPPADVCFGGPPCQATSVAAAIHGYRTGASLWPAMLRCGLAAGAEWFVVEQPPGNAAWEAEVAADLSRAGRHVAVFEFGAHDLGAPYPRRRRYVVAGPSLSRLALARAAIPQAIERAKGAAASRGDWDPAAIPPFGVDTWRSERVHERRERIEALGDSNPPAMAEAIGYMLAEAA
jgi:site-specific DNA-cytosine methylase